MFFKFMEVFSRMATAAHKQLGLKAFVLRRWLKTDTPCELALTQEAAVTTASSSDLRVPPLPSMCNK